MCCFSFYFLHPNFVYYREMFPNFSASQMETDGSISHTTVKPNIFDRDLSNDILINNNVPNGVWEDSDAGILYPDLQELEDYQAYQQPC